MVATMARNVPNGKQHYMTLEQVAVELSKIEGRKVSRERIRQIEQRALVKVAKEMKREGIRNLDVIVVG